MQNKMYIYLTVMRTLSVLGLSGRHLDPEGVGDQGESVSEVVGVRSCKKIMEITVKLSEKTVPSFDLKECIKLETYTVFRFNNF
jgi:hypothetical protein